jgi:hypothetical protein
MLYEVRTYRVKPRSQNEVMKRFGKAYGERKEFSEISAFFYCDIGPLNEIIHIWPYENLQDRTDVRVKASATPSWPPHIGEFLDEQLSEIFLPFPCTPEFKTGQIGPVFEWRSYTIKPHSLGGIQERWGEALHEREKLSPILMAMSTEIGPLNKFVHIWPYESLNHRAEIRAEAAAKGIWPPKGGGDELLRQDNKILFAAPFSPIQ